MFNLKKVSFRKKKMKERVPFAPSLYGGSLLTIILTGIPYITNAILKLSL